MNSRTDPAMKIIVFVLLATVVASLFSGLFFLVKDKDGTYTAAILAHHVVIDGMAMKVYLEQIGSVYQALLQGTHSQPQHLEQG